MEIERKAVVARTCGEGTLGVTAKGPELYTLNEWTVWQVNDVTK